MSKIFASCFGIGFIPWAPGTFGSLFAVIVWKLFSFDNVHTYLLILVFGVFLSIWISSLALEKGLESDPSWIVIDEFIGMLIALLPVVIIAFNWYMVVLAFLLFRFFDIFKPLYIGKLEKLRGAWGVVLDDVLAGVYSAILLGFVYKIFYI